MNKVSTLFDKPTHDKAPKPIQLVKFIDIDYCTVGQNNRVTDLLENASYNIFKAFNNAKLISIGDVFDVIAVWDDETESNRDMSNVAVYLGHWNDGIIE
jgi:hypothetical protein